MTPQDRLAAYSLRFGLDKPVPIAPVRKLAHDHSLSRRIRAGAFELLGHLYAGGSKYASALAAYDAAIKLAAPAKKSGIVVMKAMTLRNAGIESAMRLLEALDPASLDDNDREVYWLARLDTAEAAFDPAAIRRTVRQISKSDRRNSLMAANIKLSLSLVEFIDNWNHRAQKPKRVGPKNRRGATREL